MALFVLSKTAFYLTSWIPAAQSEAARFGYKLTVMQNDFSQTQEDQQVQQFIATGQKPAAFVWFPFIAPAAASVHALSRIAPVIQTGQLPAPSDTAAYAGINQVNIGHLMGRMFIDSRKLREKAGVRLHSPQGNMLVINFPQGQTAGTDRWSGFLAATKSAPFHVIGTVYGAFEPGSGYKVASQALPAYRSKGIDFIWVSNLGAANGVVKAAEQIGMKPGKDFSIVTGDCPGTLNNMRNGKVFGTVLYGGAVEGKLAVRTAAQYLATHQVRPGAIQLPASPTEPAPVAEPPYHDTWAPIVAAEGPQSLKSAQVWGLSAHQMCEA